ncbi:MAG: isoleucine--tRNA ligase [Acidimicrobiales bacterium]
MTGEDAADVYEPVPAVPDRVALERLVLDMWRANDVFGRLRQQTSRGEPFSFLDGPITANSPMGVHHAWGRTLKDVIQRYHAMNGRALRWQNGFDCQGLWVEVEVEKSLGFNSKQQIEDFGLDRFSAACRDRVASFASRIIDQSIRLGMWMDWDRSYYTLTDTNVSYIWRFLAECHRRGWLYRGHRLMPWCHRCGTSLSQHELTDSYTDLDHPSVFLQLPLDSDGECIAVWTTTPWTLPANVAVAVQPDAAYSLVRTPAGQVWLANERSDDVPFVGEVIKTALGSDLVGRRYEPPLTGLDAQSHVVHRVIGWSEVSLDEGTGAVHIAPGCGAQDFDLSRELGLPVLAPIDEAGRYVDGFGPLSGRHVAEVEDDILAALRATGRLAVAGRLRHRYPACWRCSTPLVHRVVDEWFIGCDEVREPMRQAAAAVSWHPRHYGKRMDDWLSNMGDWCISRKRYWGLPLPFYFCGNGHLTVVSSKEELLRRATSGIEQLRELHRPWIDTVKIRCETCGKEAERVAEVGDCWLDAGIVPFSTLGWRNPDAVPGGYATGAGAELSQADLPDHEHWQRWFPAEVVCEMHEQIRLWFYSMLFMSVVLEARAPYKSVLAYGRVNDQTGREMHKSWGNAIWFDDAVEDLGADTMRWLYTRQPPSYDLNFGYSAAREADRRFLTFWNSYAFFVTYANIGEYTPPPRLLSSPPDGAQLQPIDRWMVSRTHQLVRACRQAFETLDLPSATAAFDEFAEDLSHWYVRLTRNRFWRGDPGRLDHAVYETLWYSLVTALRCIAPVMPFVTDAMWSNLVSCVVADAPDSVHLDRFPAEHPVDKEMLAAMTEARRVTGLGRRAREDAEIRLRQPLSRLIAVTADSAARKRVVELCDLVEQECNVKHVEVADTGANFSTVEVTPDFARLGPKFREEAPRIAAMLRAGDFVRDGDNLLVAGHVVERADVQLRTRAMPGFAVAGSGGWVVALDTTLSADLEREGRARDLIRRIQQARKDAGLAVTDRIQVAVPRDSADLLDQFHHWVAQETLAEAIIVGDELKIVRDNGGRPAPRSQESS